MTHEAAMIDVMESRAVRREDRRDFFRQFGGKALLSGAAALTSSMAVAQAAPSEPDILNFALNLEYLEAQFYSIAALGVPLNNALLGGTPTRGEVVGGRPVPFQDIVVRQYAREIARDEIAHVQFLRSQLGAAAVAQPAIDIRGGAGGPFAAAAMAAGVPNGANFDPYANDDSFLLGAYIFEDVGVTAYKGAARLLNTPAVIGAAAGLLAVEAYHAGLVRTVLYGRGVQVPELRSAADAISNARDSLDGMSNLDQGISPSEGIPPNANASNIVPLDANGLAYSRTGAQVLNIVYLNNAAVMAGGFFPNGVNGPIRTSGAN